jgi:hypothetical protein
MSGIMEMENKCNLFSWKISREKRVWGTSIDRRSIIL